MSHLKREIAEKQALTGVMNTLKKPLNMINCFYFEADSEYIYIYFLNYL